LSLVKIK